MVVGTGPRFADTPEKAADVVLAAYASAVMPGEWDEYRNAIARDLSGYAESHVDDPELREALCEHSSGSTGSALGSVSTLWGVPSTSCASSSSISTWPSVATSSPVHA